MRLSGATGADILRMNGVTVTLRSPRHEAAVRKTARQLAAAKLREEACWCCGGAGRLVEHVDEPDGFDGQDIIWAERTIDEPCPACGPRRDDP